MLISGVIFMGGMSEAGRRARKKAAAISAIGGGEGGAAGHVRRRRPKADMPPSSAGKGQGRAGVLITFSAVYTSP